MPSRYLGGNGRAALAEAAEAIEARSSAEVLIAVVPRATRQLERSLAAALVTTIAALAAALYVPYVLAWHWILIDCALAGLLAAVAVDQLPPLRRALGRRAAAVDSVRRAAALDFLTRGVHHTRERTGILVHVSLAERVCAVVADAGVHAAMPHGAVRAIELELDAVIRRGGDAGALAAAIRPLADRLALDLPRRDDDTDELAAEVAA